MPIFKPQFQPVSFSWVALHPQPKGVIQFMGGAFFGSFPTVFYRHLLTQLYGAGYTLVALPFRFSFRHWAIAISLLEEQQRLRTYLPQLAKQVGYADEVYGSPASYQWLGHSLGCKYIALLELLSELELTPTNPAIAIVLGDQQTRWLSDRLTTTPSIWNQPSQLMAPDISETSSAIPVKALAHWLDRLGLGVQPTRQQTLDLIEASQLFNLTAMVSYDRDTVAGSIHDPDPATSDVGWLHQNLKHLLHRELGGKHLEPMGMKVGPWLVDLNPLDKFIKPLTQWHTGSTVLQFFQKLRFPEAADTAATAVDQAAEPLPVSASAVGDLGD